MNIIFFIHLIILIVGILIPLLGNNIQLRAYSIALVIVFFHWMMNDDTCALTMLESKLTGKETSKTFTGRIISPIFKLDDNEAKILIKTLFFILWLLTQWRLGRFRIEEFTKK